MSQTAGKVLPLADAELFHTHAYVDGAWRDGAGGTFDVLDPASGALVAQMASASAADDTTRHRGGRGRAARRGRARPRKERAARAAPLVRPDRRERRRPGDDPDRRAGQAARRGDAARSSTAPASSSGSPRRRKRVYGEVIPTNAAGRRHARRCGSRSASPPRSRPWNFPTAMILRKAAPGARRRLHDGRQAGRARRRSRRSRSPSSAERAGIPAGVLSVVTGAPAHDRRRADHEPGGAHAQLHRLDRGRQAADGAVRRHGQEARRSSSAATRRSSCSTTPTSTRRSPARSPRSSATPARPASARTGSSCRPASTTPSSSGSARRSRRCASATASTPGPSRAR